MIPMDNNLRTLCAGIRGANYVPSYAPDDVAQWAAYDPQVIERELAFARDLGLNSVRTFLSYAVYRADPPAFLERVEHFLAAAERRGLSVMLILFDACFGPAHPVPFGGGVDRQPGR